MTNEQAIAELQKEHDLIQGERDLDGSQFAPALLEALAMAIEVLKCSEIPNRSELVKKSRNIVKDLVKDDTISRQAAIDALLEEVRLIDGYYVENDEVIDKDDAIEAIRLLPTAQPYVSDTNVGDMISRQDAIEAYKAESEDL